MRDCYFFVKIIVKNLGGKKVLVLWRWDFYWENIIVFMKKLGIEGKKIFSVKFWRRFLKNSLIIIIFDFFKREKKKRLMKNKFIKNFNNLFFIF